MTYNPFQFSLNDVKELFIDDIITEYDKINGDAVISGISIPIIGIGVVTSNLALAGLGVLGYILGAKLSLRKSKTLRDKINLYFVDPKQYINKYHEGISLNTGIVFPDISENASILSELPSLRYIRANGMRFGIVTGIGVGLTTLLVASALSNYSIPTLINNMGYTALFTSIYSMHKVTNKVKEFDDLIRNRLSMYLGVSQL